ncbi:PA-PL1 PHOSPHOLIPASE FAMILY [Salix purpurea]|uniref:PA-PL1 PHOSPHOLIPASE FAMILY n=1 Tax=Salix purpurea TaxID=77065 RepID=A0A9Q0Z329_SALPP|nr:PA-PL1 PHOSPHOLIPASE FAMILY [Salix purpurea]
MTETSKARVTITLGRSGQVVKRAATVSGDYSNSQQGAGSKRSVMDRLGGSSEDSSMHGHRLSNKRQRGDSSLTSLGSNGVKDGRIGKDDLRYKLMQKNVFRRARSDDDQKTVDLREKLSRTVQPPGHPLSTNLDARQRMPEPTDTGILGRIPPTRSADDLHHMYSSRNSFSPWTLDHIRRRSPDRVTSSRGLSPPRNLDHLQRRPLNRAYDDVRTVSYMNKDVLDTPRSVSSSSTFMTKSAMPPPSTVPSMSVAPLMSQLPPPSGIVHKSSYAAEDQQTVEGLLHALGLGKYAILFKAEEVDMPALKQMGESDLKELGIPMGPRKKIILALLPRSKWHP